MFSLPSARNAHNASCSARSSWLTITLPTVPARRGQQRDAPFRGYAPNITRQRDPAHRAYRGHPDHSRARVELSQAAELPPALGGVSVCAYHVACVALRDASGRHLVTHGAQQVVGDHGVVLQQRHGHGSALRQSPPTAQVRTCRGYPELRTPCISVGQASGILLYTMCATWSRRAVPHSRREVCRESTQRCGGAGEG